MLIFIRASLPDRESACLCTQSCLCAGVAVCAVCLVGECARSQDCLADDGNVPLRCEIDAVGALHRLRNRLQLVCVRHTNMGICIRGYIRCVEVLSFRYKSVSACSRACEYLGRGGAERRAGTWGRGAGTWGERWSLKKASSQMRALRPAGRPPSMRLRVATSSRSGVASHLRGLHGRRRKRARRGAGAVDKELGERRAGARAHM